MKHVAFGDCLFGGHGFARQKWRAWIETFFYPHNNPLPKIRPPEMEGVD